MQAGARSVIVVTVIDAYRRQGMDLVETFRDILLGVDVGIDLSKEYAAVKPSSPPAP